MEAFTPLFQSVIAFVAVMTGLGFVFNLLLNPVKKDISNLRDGQDKLESGQVKLERKMDQLLEKTKA